MTEVTEDNIFNLHKVDGPRLCMPPPATMETVMEVFNEDRMAHPHTMHVFALPRLMPYLWMQYLGKDADVLVTITTGDHF